MILYGASGHAKVIIDLLERSGQKVEHLVDGDESIRELQGYKVILEDEFELSAENEIIISIGNNRIRKRLADMLHAKFGWGIHPSAQLADDVSIGEGTVVMAGAIVNSSTSIGNHCIVNTSSSIDHDCDLRDYVHVSPNATLCGTIKVGEGTHIGAGATIIPNINIGKWVTIGAGAVILSNVPDGATVVGNPGKIIKQIDV